MSRNIEGHRHLGEMLDKRYFQPRQLTIYRVVKETGVNPKILCGALTGRQPLPIREAILLARYLGEDEDFLVKSQLEFDLREHKRQMEQGFRLAA